MIGLELEPTLDLLLLRCASVLIFSGVISDSSCVHHPTHSGGVVAVTIWLPMDRDVDPRHREINVSVSRSRMGSHDFDPLENEGDAGFCVSLI